MKIYDAGAWLAGPLIRNKVWFSFSGHDQKLNQYLLGNYDPNGNQVLDDNLMWTTSAKVAWQVTKGAQLSYFNNLQYKLIGHRNGGGTFAESRARNLNEESAEFPTALRRGCGSREQGQQKQPRNQTLDHAETLFPSRWASAPE